MISGSTLSYFFGFWALAYLIDAGLSVHPFTKQRYLELRGRSGISIQVLQARFFTQKLNPFFQRLGSVDWFPWGLWFSVGTAFSAIFMCLSVVVLSLLAYNTVMRKPIEKQIITPVMPGVNLPVSHIGFYMLTLLICVVLHEAGHALAALREKVRLHGFGFFLFGIYPGAYVDISDSDLCSLSPLRQLKIYCAGVWHNGVIVLISLLVFHALPWLLVPVYSTNRGVGVVSVLEHSVFTGHRGLHSGDAITQINACPVNTADEWYRCLEEVQQKTSGYCVPGGYLNMLDPGHVRAQPGARRLSAVLPADQAEVAKGLPRVPADTVAASKALVVAASHDCCAPHLASTHLCFAHFHSLGKHGKQARKPKYVCLPARAVTEREPCSAPSDCGPLATEGDQRPICLIPAPPDNHTHLIRIVHNRARSPAILFLGPVEDLLASIEISNYVPRWPQLFPCRLPQIIATFCIYLFSLSGALVLLNVVPCYALDGQWILKALLDLLLPSFICGRQFKRILFSSIIALGTGLLSINIALALWYLILETGVTPTLPTSPARPAPQTSL
ncbi:hypothetical protein AAHC03_013510 [Spirometra sp. Aus1]